MQVSVKVMLSSNSTVLLTFSVLGLFSLLCLFLCCGQVILVLYYYLYSASTNVVFLHLWV